jgi:transposase InsO family protein
VIHVIPTHTDLTAEGSACILRDHVFRLHGLPKKIISDRGPQFVSQFMKEFYRLVGIEGAPSTAFHPQTNGQTEWVNQEIEQYLRLFINYHQSDWAEWLSIAEFSLNDKVSSSTGYTPFFLNYGQHPRTGQEIVDKSCNQRAEDFAHSLKQA